MNFPASNPHRFTIDGSAALERSLASLCGRIAQEVLKIVGPHKLEALVLAGGYGRGQGGVLKAGGADAPYNDLEFYVFLRGPDWLNAVRYSRKFQQLESALSPGARLHVEFKVDSLEKLRCRPVSIFSYDLVSAQPFSAMSRLLPGANFTLTPAPSLLRKPPGCCSIDVRACSWQENCCPNTR